MLKQSQRPCVPNSFKGLLSQLKGAVPTVTRVPGPSVTDVAGRTASPFPLAV